MANEQVSIEELKRVENEWIEAHRGSPTGSKCRGGAMSPCGSCELRRETQRKANGGKSK